jgi:hypothetical protein
MEINWHEPLEMQLSGGEWRDVEVKIHPGLREKDIKLLFGVEINNLTDIYLFTETGECIAQFNNNYCWKVEGKYQIRNKIPNIIFRILDLREAYSSKYMKNPDVVYVGVKEAGEILLDLRNKLIIKETSVDPRIVDGATIEGMNVLRIFKQSYLQVGEL